MHQRHNLYSPFIDVQAEGHVEEQSPNRSIDRCSCVGSFLPCWSGFPAIFLRLRLALSLEEHEVSIHVKQKAEGLSEVAQRLLDPAPVEIENVHQLAERRLDPAQPLVYAERRVGGTVVEEKDLEWFFPSRPWHGCLLRHHVLSGRVQGPLRGKRQSSRCAVICDARGRLVAADVPHSPIRDDAVFLSRLVLCGAGLRQARHGEHPQQVHETLLGPFQVDEAMHLILREHRRSASRAGEAKAKSTGRGGRSRAVASAIFFRVLPPQAHQSRGSPLSEAPRRPEDARRVALRP
mmetsp:Transcript_4152/g.16113  ORF Transcript_4152/g.16113 Transcript_4152/m.16113 type:complete len:292 (+) Transcript_4152:3592-4467(+)